MLTIAYYGLSCGRETEGEDCQVVPHRGPVRAIECVCFDWYVRLLGSGEQDRARGSRETRWQDGIRTMLAVTYVSQHGQTTGLWLNILTVGTPGAHWLILFTTTATLTDHGASVVQREKT